MIMIPTIVIFGAICIAAFMFNIIVGIIVTWVCVLAVTLVAESEKQPQQQQPQDQRFL